MEESVRNALRSMLKTAVFAKKKDDELTDIGFADTPMFEVYGYAADAIYYLIGEHTQSFDESVTYDVLNHPGLTPDEMFNILAEEYEKNHTK